VARAAPKWLLDGANADANLPCQLRLRAHHLPTSIVRHGPLLTGYNRVKRTARFPVNTRESWRFRDVRGRPETA